MKTKMVYEFKYNIIIKPLIASIITLFCYLYILFINNQLIDQSKMSLRLMAMGGFLLSFLSLLVAFIFLVVKFIYRDSFPLGTAPIVIGIFFFGATQTFSIGVLGKYIGSIHTHVRKMPLVVDLERVNC